jgi:hypothetical protein
MMAGRLYDETHGRVQVPVDCHTENSGDPFPEADGESVRRTKRRGPIPEFPGLSRAIEALAAEGDMDSRVRLLELSQSVAGGNERSTSEDSQERILRIADAFKMAFDRIGGFSNLKAHEEADGNEVDTWDVITVKMLKETIRALGY